MYLNTNRAKNIKNKLRINENLHDAQMKLLKEDINHLNQEFLNIEHKRLKNDNEDLQHEFEHDRQRYLNTIRTQEKQLLLFCAILEKMSNTMQHNCNYGNIDKIIEQARYDEEKKT
ncbi:unnamed protein product [Rotaria sp. Silwood1]|nr:unnamed protein product [Rotaria sp. Silwood1]